MVVILIGHEFLRDPAEIKNHDSGKEQKEQKPATYRTQVNRSHQHRKALRLSPKALSLGHSFSPLLWPLAKQFLLTQPMAFDVAIDAQYSAPIERGSAPV